MSSQPPLYESLLQEFIVFRDLDVAEYDSVASAIDRRRIDEGTEIIRTGERSRELYGLIAGRVEVLRRDDEGRDRRLAVLEPHAVLGELGFVLGDPRTATVRAIEPLDVWCLDGQMFDQLSADHDEAARAIEDNIIRMMAQRQTEMNKELLKLMNEAAGEGSYHVDDDDVGEQLMRRWNV